MLDAFIIEEIKRRERQEEIKRDGNRPRQELPLPPRTPIRREEDEDNNKDKGGVIIIDYSLPIPAYSIGKDNNLYKLIRDF